MDDPGKNSSDHHHGDVNQSTMNKTVNGSQALTRRRLLKGAMATTPAIFTLQSGAARAAMSNVLCIAKAPVFNAATNYTHIPPILDGVEEPDWAREDVRGIIVRNGEMTELALIPDGSNYQDQQGGLWVMKFIGAGFGYVEDALKYDHRLSDATSEFYKEHFYSQIGASIDRSKVVYVDNDGVYVASDRLGHPVTVSCWASFQ